MEMNSFKLFGLKQGVGVGVGIVFYPAQNCLKW